MQALPLGTALFASICVGVFLMQNSFRFNVGSLAIGAFPIVFEGEWYRIVTSAFLHGGILHIGMNMMSLLAMGPSVESLLGTVAFVLLIVATVLVGGLLYVGMSLVGWAVTGDMAWLHIYAVGFSGVLFALAVEEATLSPLPSRSVFGLFSVPTRLYPWVLLVLMQFVLPNISFFGHLAGLLVGVLHVGRALSWLLPSHDACRQLEQLPAIRSLPLLQRAPTLDVIAAAAQRAGARAGCFGTLSLAFAALWEGVGPILLWIGGGLTSCLRGIGLGSAVDAVIRCVLRTGARLQGVFGAAQQQQQQQDQQSAESGGRAGAEQDGVFANDVEANGVDGQPNHGQSRGEDTRPTRDWGSGRVGP